MFDLSAYLEYSKQIERAAEDCMKDKEYPHIPSCASSEDIPYTPLRLWYTIMTILRTRFQQIFPLSLTISPMATWRVGTFNWRVSLILKVVSGLVNIGNPVTLPLLCLFKWYFLCMNHTNRNSFFFQFSSITVNFFVIVLGGVSGVNFNRYHCLWGRLRGFSGSVLTFSINYANVL